MSIEGIRRRLVGLGQGTGWESALTVVATLSKSCAKFLAVLEFTTSILLFLSSGLLIGVDFALEPQLLGTGTFGGAPDGT